MGRHWWVWKNYWLDPSIYLTIKLSDKYGIILYHSISGTGHGKNVFYWMNARDKHYLKKMEHVGH